MSDTIIDMAKVTQALDNGWDLKLWRNQMGSYSVQAVHARVEIMRRALEKLAAEHAKIEGALYDDEWHADLDEIGNPIFLFTDDFTPEQALTRMAYKIHGEVI